LKAAIKPAWENLMKYCGKCKVKVNMELQKCPLCSMTLTDAETQVQEAGEKCPDPENRTQQPGACGIGYPPPDTGNTERYNFVLRLFLFISVAIGSASLLFNLMTFRGVLWSLYVIGTMLYLWIVVAYPLFKKRKIGHIIVVDAISTSVYVYCLELGTRTKGWGLSYVTPFILIGATLMITFIILLKRLKWREYSTYQTIMVALGFLPVIFCLAGLVTPVWPSVLSAFYSFLTLTGMFIFVDKKYKNELIRRFHL
jgi:hypothetical protein